MTEKQKLILSSLSKFDRRKRLENAMKDGRTVFELALTTKMSTDAVRSALYRLRDRGLVTAHTRGFGMPNTNSTADVWFLRN